MRCRDDAREAGRDCISAFSDYNRRFMLPASFQTPAAMILLVGGVISCFAGYRVFRVVLGIYGFIIGALFASGLAGPEHTVLDDRARRSPAASSAR